MKKKGQTTFNNENVHRIKMFVSLYSPWLLDIFHQRGKVIDSSPASMSKCRGSRLADRGRGCGCGARSRVRVLTSSQQHKGSLIVVVRFFVYLRHVSSPTETSSGNKYY